MPFDRAVKLRTAELGRQLVDRRTDHGLVWSRQPEFRDIRPAMGESDASITQTPWRRSSETRQVNV